MSPVFHVQSYDHLHFPPKLFYTVLTSVTTTVFSTSPQHCEPKKKYLNSFHAIGDFALNQYCEK